MTGTTERFKKTPVRKKAPVKRIKVSPDAERAYEDLVRGRDDRHKSYGRFLPAENKSK